MEGLDFPTASKGFDELNGGYKTLAGELRIAPLGLQRLPARVHHFEIADNPGAVTVCRQIGGTAGINNGALLGFGLLGQVVYAGKTVFHFAKSNEHLLAVVRDAFLIGGL